MKRGHETFISFDTRERHRISVFFVPSFRTQLAIPGRNTISINPRPRWIAKILNARQERSQRRLGFTTIDLKLNGENDRPAWFFALISPASFCLHQSA